MPSRSCGQAWKGGRAFLERINTIVADADIKIACAIIDKTRLTERYTDPWDPYGLVLTFCMEKVAREHPRTNGRRRLNVIFEAPRRARGPRA